MHEDYPKTLLELERRFCTEEACVRSEEHTSELQSLSIHDALPIWYLLDATNPKIYCFGPCTRIIRRRYLSWSDAFVPKKPVLDRKSTRLNSSHFPYTTLFRSGIYLTPPTPRYIVLGHARGLSEDAT